MTRAMMTTTLATVCVALVTSGTARTQGPQIARSQISFKETGSGEVLIRGVHLGFTMYTTQNGEPAVGKDTLFNTAIEADSFLRDRLSDAKFVKSYTNQKDAAGNVIGQRAQALFPNQSGRPIPGILWTHGPQYYEVSSTSQQTAVALEEEYRFKIQRGPN